MAPGGHHRGGPLQCPGPAQASGYHVTTQKLFSEASQPNMLDGSPKKRFAARARRSGFVSRSWDGVSFTRSSPAHALYPATNTTSSIAVVGGYAAPYDLWHKARASTGLLRQNQPPPGSGTRINPGLHLQTAYMYQNNAWAPVTPDLIPPGLFQLGTPPPPPDLVLPNPLMERPQEDKQAERRRAIRNCAIGEHGASSARRGARRPTGTLVADDGLYYSGG